MEKLKVFIREYEELILNKKIIGKKPFKLYLFSILFFLILGGLTFAFGYVFNCLHQINYLFVMTNVIIIASYIFYKSIMARHYGRVNREEVNIWKMNSLNILYASSIITTASTFLSFTIFFRVLSIFVAMIFLILSVVTVLLYFFIEREKTRIKMSGAWNTILNGFFVAVLFYTVTMLVQINNIPLSFVVTMPIMLVLIVIKRTIERKFVVRVTRLAILGLGVFFVIISIPFTMSFSFISVYRGEFTFRIIYEKLDNPIMELEEGTTGDVVFYDDQIIVVNDEITFYSNDLVKQKSLTNDYEHLYEMNDRLFAQKTDISYPGSITLYEYNGTDFDLVDSYIGTISEPVFLDENNEVYKQYDAYVYRGENGNLKRLSSTGLDDFTEIIKEDDFVTFKYDRVVFGSSDSFMNQSAGEYYNLAYHNDHMAFIYLTSFVKYNEEKVNPKDLGNTILYLVDYEEYMNDEAALQNSIEFPKLFRLNNFYYFDGHYYLVGHTQYANGVKFGRMYVYDEEGVLEFEAIYPDENVSVGENYIVYGEDTLRFYEVDSGTSSTYQLITGYGAMWIVLCGVSLFAIKEIHLNPHRDLKYKLKEKAE